VRVRGREYRVILTPDLEAGGYAIRVPELPGCFSEADTIAEARRMAREAIALWLDADGGRRKASRARTARRPSKTGADAQLSAWRKLAGKWESDVDRATEAERLMKRRTFGRKVES
jgi:predicted RNase H-like HicB family nuclease